MAHSLQEDRLKAAVMDQNGVLDFYQFGQELPPDAALVRRTVSPKAVVNDRVARFDSNANQVVEVSIGQTLDIGVNRCASSIFISGLPTIWTFFSRIASAFNEWWYLSLLSLNPCGRRRGRKV